MLVTRAVMLSVEMDSHFSLHSTDFHIWLEVACVHACISVGPVSSRNLLSSREAEFDVCLLGVVLQTALPITVLTCSEASQCLSSLLAEVLEFNSDVLYLKAED